MVKKGSDKAPQLSEGAGELAKCNHTRVVIAGGLIGLAWTLLR